MVPPYHQYSPLDLIYGHLGLNFVIKHGLQSIVLDIAVVVNCNIVVVRLQYSMNNTAIW